MSTSNFKNLSMNWEKYGFRWENWNFEPIANYVYTTKSFAWGNALNIYIDYLMFYRDRRLVKLKKIISLEVQVYIQQWFTGEQGVSFM